MNNSQKIKHNKKILIKALRKTLGIVTPACEMCDLSRQTFYKYYNEDEDFKAKVDSMADIAVDFAETKLTELIEDKNPTAVIFYLKTKGKDRGYIEKSELEVTDRNVAKSIVDEAEKRVGNGNNK